MKKYWHGKEIEGRLTGIESLFIAADFKEFNNVAKKFSHILIGTTLVDEMFKKKTEINWDRIEQMIDDENKYFSIEAKPNQLKKIPHSMKLKCHILLWIDVPELSQLKSSDSIKVCHQNHDMRVFTLFNGQRVTRDDYMHDRYDL